MSTAKPGKPVKGAVDSGFDAVLAMIRAAREQPELRGSTRPNLFRMRQFYETYAGDQIVSALPRQLSWTHNLINVSQSKHPDQKAGGGE